MRVRNIQRHGDEEIELQMTSMIDVVFLLLIFFILTFKIVTPEGDFNVKMPLAAPSEGKPEENQFPPIVIHLKAGPSGVLTSIATNEKKLKDFQELHNFLLDIVNDNGGPGSPGAEATEVELDCSPDLHFEYVIDAITAVSGFVSEEDGKIKTMIEKIKFSPPRG
ncbi:MAG: biopolymer transporter ExbD [Candidatus Nealsonbacteria bacterium]|nr:biopolymer transporter ExbD [Candidatus Nealsonbacteria bacterium]